MNFKSSRRLTVLLAVVAVAMFGFGYAMVPLYNVLCVKLGFNGKISNDADKSSNVVDNSRIITVQFLATNNAYLPWEFRPQQKTVQIHPGQNTRVSYYAKNLSGITMTVQAIPNVTPGEAAKYLRKTECFCFSQQTLKSHEAMDMPILFHLDRDLPKDIKTVTLSYTLFDVTGKAAKLKVKQQGKIK